VMNILEKIGGNIQCVSSREHIIYQSSVFKHDIPETLSLLADTVQTPLITADEIEEGKFTIEYEMQETFSKPEWQVSEYAHRTAFEGNSYGLPTICPREKFDGVTGDLVRRYREIFYRPENYVVAGVGIEHEQMCEMVKRYFDCTTLAPSISLAQEEQVASRKSVVKYTGGESDYDLDQNSTDNLTRIFLGFNAPEFGNDDLYAASVLQVMLGGGDSFSAGGPGKGMYSRLYMQVLNRYHWVESIKAVIYPYKDAGLFGLQATVPPNCISNMMTVMGTEIRKLMDKPVPREELERAKNQLRSTLFMNLESKLVHLEDLGRQVQMRGYRMTPREMSEKVEQVTEADLKRVLLSMISSNPTVMMLGETKFAPNLQRFEKMFGIGRKYAY
jgi:mitochondrial-processing peptidase subunit alpha